MAEDNGLAASLTLLFATLEPSAIAAALNQVVPADVYWPVVRGWMKLNGDQAIVLAAEDIIESLDDHDLLEAVDAQTLRATVNQMVWDYEIDDKIYETLGYCRDEIRDDMLKQGLVKEKPDGDANDH